MLLGRVLQLPNTTASAKSLSKTPDLAFVDIIAQYLSRRL